MMATNHQSRVEGRAMAKIVVLVLLSAVALSILYGVLVRAEAGKRCERNLLKIYRALELYELDRGELPALAYFPNEPKEDTDSLRLVLENFGVDANACVCPAHPTMIREMGLTYIWNTALNGQKMPRGAEPTWMLVDLTALSTDLPASHFGGYNVLYSDGKVRRVRDPLRSLRGL